MRFFSRAAGATDWDTLSATHYGLGYEVREAQGGNSKVITSLPQGLGRYAANGEKEWYVKNRLGSTMLVYGGGKVAAAYDYRSFGKRVAVVVPADKVTEEFTGKELDEETDLGYWGARYLDADLGLWVSVDPARQFMNPYAYAGNGTNSVNGVDGDGNIIKMYSYNSEDYNNKVNIAIKEIENSGAAGKAFIAKLKNSEHTTIIKEYRKRNHTAPTLFGHIKNFFGFGGDATVYWNPNIVMGGKNAEGYSERPNAIGLGHELGHVEDIFDGKFTTDKSLNKNGIPISEENSLFRENQIREDLGEPLREKY